MPKKKAFKCYIVFKEGGSSINCCGLRGLIGSTAGKKGGWEGSGRIAQEKRWTLLARGGSVK